MESLDADDAPVDPEQPASSSVPAERVTPARSLVRAGDMALLGDGVERGEDSQRPGCPKKQTGCCKKSVSAVLKKASRGPDWPTLVAPTAEDGSCFVHDRKKSAEAEARRGSLLAGRARPRTPRLRTGQHAYGA